MGYGQGSAGIPGTVFQLLIINIMMAFGVSLGQMIAAFSPSIQVLHQPFCIPTLTKAFQDCCPRQPFSPIGPWHFLWCCNPVPSHDEVLAIIGLPTQPVYPINGGHGVHGVGVSEAISLQFSQC